MDMFEDQMDNLEHYAINSKKKGRRKRFCPYDREFYELTRFFKTQDSNLRFSHKQGTLEVENVDASDLPIYAPHLADKNYNKDNKEDGINYNESCGYMCIPSNKYESTSAI